MPCSLNSPIKYMTHQMLYLFVSGELFSVSWSDWVLPPASCLHRISTPSGTLFSLSGNVDKGKQHKELTKNTRGKSDFTVLG